MPKLVVIEAPGKIDVFRSLLCGVGVSDFVIIATYGRLFDLSPDIELPDPPKLSAILDTPWVPLRTGVITSLQNRAATADEIYVFTDDDGEGELIAEQVRNLSPPSKTITRFRIHELTIDGMSRALANPGRIDEHVVCATRARRLCDRTIGHHSGAKAAGKKEFNASLGRVLTPLMGLASKGEFSGQQIIREIGRDGWHAVVNVDSQDSDAGTNAARLLSMLAVPSIEQIEVHDDSGLRSPGNASAIVAELSEELQLTPTEVAEELQSLYEAGLVGYPRTDSVRLEHRSVERLTEFAYETGSPFDPEYLQALAQVADEQVVNKQGAHEALLPLSLPRDIGVNLKFLNRRSRVFCALTEYWLSIGNPEGSRRIEVGIQGKGPGDQGWGSLLSVPGVINLRFVRHTQRRRRVGKYQSVSPLNRHGIQVNATQFPQKTLLLKPCFELRVFKALVRLSLGRPSNQPMHARTFCERFLDPAGHLTPGAIHRGLTPARAYAPLLLDPAISVAMESALGDPGHADVASKITAALQIAKLADRFAVAEAPNPTVPSQPSKSPFPI